MVSFQEKEIMEIIYSYLTDMSFCKIKIKVSEKELMLFLGFIIQKEKKIVIQERE